MSKLALPPKERIQFNMALTHFRRLDKPLVTKKIHPITRQPIDELTLESEKELDQWYFEFKKFPLPENIVDEALKQISDQIKYEMKQQGMIR